MLKDPMMKSTLTDLRRENGAAAVINHHFQNGETTCRQLSKRPPNNRTIFAVEVTAITLALKVFETENVSSWGGHEPPAFGFMPNALTIWAIRVRHLLSHFFEYWLWWYRYFWNRVNIWNVNCTRATAFSFHTRTDILLKLSTFFETGNVSTWGVTYYICRSPYSLRDHLPDGVQYIEWNEPLSRMKGKGQTFCKNWNKI